MFIWEFGIYKKVCLTRKFSLSIYEDLQGHVTKWKNKKKEENITVLWVKFCLPPNLHADAAKYRVIKNLQRGSQAAVRSLGGPNPGWAAPLERAATWTRPGAGAGLSAGRGRRRRSRLCGYPEVKPPASRTIPACGVLLPHQVNSHTQPATLPASQEGKSGDFFKPLAVSQETIKRGRLAGGGDEAGGQSGSEASECGVSVFLWSVNCASTDFLNKKLKLN